MLGKRKAMKAMAAQAKNNAEVDDDDNIVAMVESKDVDDGNLMFEEDNKKQKQRPQKEKEKDPFELPKSMMEKYGGNEMKLSRKE